MSKVPGFRSTMHALSGIIICTSPMTQWATSGGQRFDTFIVLFLVFPKIMAVSPF